MKTKAKCKLTVNDLKAEKKYFCSRTILEFNFIFRNKITVFVPNRNFTQEYFCMKNPIIV